MASGVNQLTHGLSTPAEVFVVQFAADPSDFKTTGEVVHPQVGNARGQMTILDMTDGSTFLLGRRTSLAAGVAFRRG